MERKQYNRKKYIVGYHTQECRVEGVLDAPKECNRKDAWLGKGYYFWVDLDFAHYWGEDFKMATGSYDIYMADIDDELLLDTVFNEEGYDFFISKIEKTINHLKAIGVKEVDLHSVNRYLTENVWTSIKITGIIFEDVPKNTKSRTFSEIPPLHYRKRIQVNVFNKEIINNFVLHLEEQT